MLPFLYLRADTGPSVKRRRDDEYFNDVTEFYQYAAVVMYVNQFSSPIVRYQRREFKDFPTFTPEDTEAYDTVIQLPNGADLWAKVRTAIQNHIDDRYTSKLLFPAPDDVYYYIACWLTMPDIPGLEPLLHELGIELPVDAMDRRDAVDQIIGKPGALDERPWHPPAAMRLSMKAFNSMVAHQDRWTPFFELALARVSSLLDDAFETFGSELTEDFVTFRGVSKPSMYKGLWYNEDDSPITHRWLQALPASVVSSSIDREVALLFCERNPSCVLYVFRMSAGMRLIRPETLLQRAHGGYSEREYLIPRGCSYELVEQHKETANGHDVHVCEVLVRPPPPKAR